MGSLHDTVTWYKTRHAGWFEKNATASKNKAISTSQAWLFFVKDVPVRSLPSSRADFTPCDSFMLNFELKFNPYSTIRLYKHLVTVPEISVLPTRTKLSLLQRICKALTSIGKVSHEIDPNIAFATRSPDYSVTSFLVLTPHYAC